MPGLQADKYAEVDARAQSGNLPMLRALHDFRSVSLHPIDPAALKEMGGDDYIAHSARLQLAFKILREVRSRNEKALVFLHSKRSKTSWRSLSNARLDAPHQRLFAVTLLSHRRQEIVDDQSSAQPGFGVLILSPRAAGVGLNIVSANHVIHL